MLLKDNQYTLYKVKKIEGDTVYFFPNKYETDMASGLRDLAAKGDQGFDTTLTYGLSKSELVEMHKKRDIIDIDRK